MKGLLFAILFVFISVNAQNTQNILLNAPQSLKQIAVKNGAIWAIDKQQQVHHWQKEKGWHTTKDRLEQISIGADGCAWGIYKNKVFWWNTTLKKWSQMPGNLQQIAVGTKANVWGINNGHVFYWHQSKWQQVSGTLLQISVGEDGTVYGLDSKGQALKWQAKLQNWHSIGKENLRQICVKNAYNIWAINFYGELYQKQKNVWTKISSPPLTQIALYQNQILGLTVSNHIFRYSHTPTARASTPWSVTELREVVEKYAPYLYFDKEEKYYTSSVGWFLDRAELVKLKEKKEEIVAVPPKTRPQLEKIKSKHKGLEFYPKIHKEAGKKGHIETTMVYINAKRKDPNQYYTDIQYWFYYPFNGSGTVIVFDKIFQVPLFGEHTGDWEHVTVRVDNDTKKIIAMYFSQHADGEWVFDLSKIKFRQGRPVIYASKDGHASYYSPGDHKRAIFNIGLVDRTSKGLLLDCAGKCQFLAAWDGIKGPAIVPPKWLDFPYDWGPPEVAYSKELLYKLFPEIPKWALDTVAPIFKELWSTIVSGGPSGPKQKGSWKGPE